MFKMREMFKMFETAGPQHFVRIEQIEQRAESRPPPRTTLAHPAVETALRPYPDIPGEWSDAIERLVSRPCPEAESTERWACACRGVERFAQQWTAKTKSLGWTFEELFALREPFANVSLQGAAWFVGDSTVTAVTAAAITLHTEGGATQRIYRKSEPHYSEPLAKKHDREHEGLRGRV
jgi:hypothetical protein